MIITLQALAISMPFIVSVALLLGALLDFFYYRLPNKLFYIVFYLFPIYLILSFKYHLVSNYLIFLVTMLVSVGLFSASFIGGGDAKLLSAVSLWMGWNHIVPFLVWMAILGCLIAVLYLSSSKVIYYITARFRALVYHNEKIQKFVRFFIKDLDTIEAEVVALQKQGMIIPYGIAIAGAGLIVFLQRMTSL
jgi:Flp pilus assembly protein protease CpaA